MCVCVTVAYTCPCDIVAAQCDPEIEGIQTQLVERTTKNHCVDRRLEAPVTGFEAYSPALKHISLEIILIRMNNEVREKHTIFLNHNFCSHVITFIYIFL